MDIIITCVFCDRIHAGQYDTAFYQYGEMVAVAFEPLSPVTEGHRLYIPVQHIEDACENPRIAGIVFAEAAGDMRDRSRKAASLNLITSVGADATQTIRHFHVHMIPRRPGDGLALPWTGQAARMNSTDSTSH
jgi:histidine triad (HIT) family protein